MITLEPWRVTIENAKYGFTLLVRAHNISEEQEAINRFNAVTFKTSNNVTSNKPPKGKNILGIHRREA